MWETASSSCASVQDAIGEDFHTRYTSLRGDAVRIDGLSTITDGLLLNMLFIFRKHLVVKPAGQCAVSSLFIEAMLRKQGTLNVLKLPLI